MRGYTETGAALTPMAAVNGLGEVRAAYDTRNRGWPPLHLC
jgi:hypothetical protein